MKPVACVIPCWMLWVAGTSVTSSEPSLPRIASFCWISGSMIIVVLIAPPPGRNKCAAIIAWVGKAFSNPAARKAIRAQAKWGRQDNAQVSSPNAPRRSGTRGRPRPRLCQASQQLGELARPHCAMERRHTGFILSVWIRAGPNQELHDGVLRVGVPRRRPWSSISRVVEGFGTTPVSRADVRASGHELLGDVSLVRRSRNVQGCLASVSVGGDFL